MVDRMEGDQPAEGGQSTEAGVDTALDVTSTQLTQAGNPDTTTDGVEGCTPPATSQPRVPAQTDPTPTPRSSPPPSPPTHPLTHPQPAEKHSRETNSLEPDSTASRKKRPRLAETRQVTDATEPAITAGPATNTGAKHGRSTGHDGGTGSGRGHGKQTQSAPFVSRCTRSSAQKCEYLFIYPNTSKDANHCALSGHGTAERMHIFLAQ